MGEGLSPSAAVDLRVLLVQQPPEFIGDRLLLPSYSVGLVFG